MATESTKPHQSSGTRVLWVPHKNHLLVGSFFFFFFFLVMMDWLLANPIINNVQTIDKSLDKIVLLVSFSQSRSSYGHS